MRHASARWIFALAIIASPALDAQSAPKLAMGKLVPVSDIRSDWLDGGVESPNGRFYLTGSYASNDSGFLRYDRVKRSWAHLGRGNVGAAPKIARRIVSNHRGELHVASALGHGTTVRVTFPARA